MPSNIRLRSLLPPLLLTLLTLLTPTHSTLYEAESGSLSGVSLGTSIPGFTGRGYVEGFDDAADTLTITIETGETGLYDLSVRYSAPYGAKYTRLLVDGVAVGEVALEETQEGVWRSVFAGQVLLEEVGSHEVTLSANWGWYLIDSLTVLPSPPRPPHSVTPGLVTPNSLASAENLHAYLLSQYGKKILSGQQDIQYITWLEQTVNKTVAIAGLDFMDYSPSRVERGTVGTALEEAVAWDARGGIVTFTWHWNAPSGLIDIEGKEWWRGFYTDATTFDLAQALSDPASADYALLLRDIDAIAALLKALQARNIPVLWRPLHEAEGGWFWWGAKGPEPCKMLWELLYHRLTGLHGLRNLIWVWNSVSPAWLPPLSTIDILSYDSYPSIGDHSPLSGVFTSLQALSNDTKLTALAEVGSIPDPSLVRAYGVRWSWFCTWGGEFIQDGRWNEGEFLKSVLESEWVVNLEGLPVGWKGAAETGGTTLVTVTASTSRSTTRTTTTTATRTSTRTTTRTASTTSTATKTATTTARTTSRATGRVTSTRGARDPKPTFLPPWWPWW